MQASRINDKLDASIDKEILREELSKIEGLTGIPEADSEFPWDVTSSENYKFRINANGTVEKIVPEGTISETESFVGYYADTDGDDEIDGVIYADLAIGGSGQWGDYDGTYTIPTETGLKSYCKKTASFPDGITEDPFKTGKTTSEVIAPIDSNSTDLKDRFYVMALSDFNSGNYYHWDNNCHYVDFGTAESFGTGRSNTDTMINYWLSHDPGSGNEGWNSEYDIWANIENEYNNDWFVPSKEEWSAFAHKLGISNSGSDDKYYEELGLGVRYWSSSQLSNFDDRAWYACVGNGYMDDYYVFGYDYDGRLVRLSTTF